MRATVGGVGVDYRCEGDDFPCIVRRRYGGMRAALARQLRSSPRFSFVDVRGSGRSGGDPDATVPVVLVDDRDQAREAIGLGRVAGMAHSAPGCLAVENAIRYPRRASHLAPSGSPPNDARREEAPRHRAALGAKSGSSRTPPSGHSS